MAGNEQKYYDRVAKEIARNDIKHHLFARAWAKAGDRNAEALAIYSRLRVEELKSKGDGKRKVQGRGGDAKMAEKNIRASGKEEYPMSLTERIVASMIASVLYIVLFYCAVSLGSLAGKALFELGSVPIGTPPFLAGMRGVLYAIIRDSPACSITLMLSPFGIIPIALAMFRRDMPRVRFYIILFSVCMGAVALFGGLVIACIILVIVCIMAVWCIGNKARGKWDDMAMLMESENLNDIKRCVERAKSAGWWWLLFLPLVVPDAYSWFIFVGLFFFLPEMLAVVFLFPYLYTKVKLLIINGRVRRLNASI